jgi:hypothetical protein
MRDQLESTRTNVNSKVEHTGTDDESIKNVLQEKAVRADKQNEEKRKKPNKPEEQEGMPQHQHCPVLMMKVHFFIKYYISLKIMSHKDLRTM